MTEKNDITARQTATLAEKTNDLELAACLCTLGFECRGMQRIKSADLATAAAHPDGVCYWDFATRSEDGRYTLQEVLLAWKNDAWLTDPATTAPLAHIIVAFRNRRRLMDWCKQSKAMVAVKHGNRWAFVPEDAPASHLARAMAFLQGIPPGQRVIYHHQSRRIQRTQPPAAIMIPKSRNTSQSGAVRRNSSVRSMLRLLAAARAARHLSPMPVLMLVF